nr:uncharacterized protein LOC109414853 isoform X2 [Aedes albopictus]
MGKSGKKSRKTKPVPNKAVKNLRSAAKSKNLEFLLAVPKESRNQNKSIDGEPPVAAASSRERSTKKPSQRKTKPDTKTELTAAKCTVPAPPIDMDADDNHNLLDIRTSILQDWTTEMESDEGDIESTDIVTSDDEQDSYENNTLLQPARREFFPLDDSSDHDPEDSDSARADVRKTYTRSAPPRPDESEVAHVADQRSSLPAATSEAAVCVCGQQPKIDELLQQNAMLSAQNKKLKHLNDESNARCLTLTDALNAKVLGPTHDEIFTEVEGFPDREKLKNFSEAAGSRDYIFVKLILQEICTEGLKNITITGRATNNPNGRKGGERPQQPENAPTKIQLDPEKKAYIEKRFVEHRRYQGDSISVAALKCKECCGLMTRDISYYGNK